VDGDLTGLSNAEGARKSTPTLILTTIYTEVIMKNIVFSTASLLGKASKLVVSITGSTFSHIKNGYVSGYTGQHLVNDVKPADEPQQAQTQVVNPTPVQKEFDFGDLR
tara:strand:+ start:2823 stop:3146 length:324 start_codon:yes stop_codon:yes gene_type:complete